MRCSSFLFGDSSREKADFELIWSLRLSDEGSRGFWSICWLDIGVLQRDAMRIFPAMRWDQLVMHFLVY